MAQQTGVAAVKQKERILAALRSPSPSPIESDTQTLLTLLRPVAVQPRGTWEHGFARLDASGRIKDAVLFTSLGWASETRFEILVQDDRILVRRGCGTSALDRRGRLTIPDHVRSLLGLSAGDGVLCSGDPDGDLLVVTPARCCDEVVCA